MCRALLRSVVGTSELSSLALLAADAMTSFQPMRSAKLASLYCSVPFCAASGA